MEIGPRGRGDLCLEMGIERESNKSMFRKMRERERERERERICKG